jgi:hypothetical protein
MTLIIFACHSPVIVVQLAILALVLYLLALSLTVLAASRPALTSNVKKEPTYERFCVLVKL